MLGPCACAEAAEHKGANGPEKPWGSGVGLWKSYRTRVLPGWRHGQTVGYTLRGTCGVEIENLSRPYLVLACDVALRVQYMRSQYRRNTVLGARVVLSSTHYGFLNPRSRSEEYQRKALHTLHMIVNKTKRYTPRPSGRTAVRLVPWRLVATISWVE
jgi:hypothetical protein